MRVAVVIAGGAFSVVAAQRDAPADRRPGALAAAARRRAARRHREQRSPRSSTASASCWFPAFADICVIDVRRGDHVERLGVIADPTPPTSRSACAPAARRRWRRPRSCGPCCARPSTRPSCGPTPATRPTTRSCARSPSARTSTSRCAAAAATSARSRCWRSRAPTARSTSSSPHLLAGRIGLALDNAGLFAELESLQLRLTTALDTLAEAVTIQDDRRPARLRQRRGRRARSASRPPSSCWPRRRARSSTPTSPSTRTAAAARSSTCPAARLLAGRDAGAAARPRRSTAHGRGALADRQGDRRSPGRAALAVNVIEDVTEVKRAELAQRFLAEAGAVLASSLDYEQTLARIAELAVPRLADWCASRSRDGDRLRTRRRRPRRSGQGRASRATTSSATRRRSTRPTGAAQVLRDGVLAADQRHHRRRCWTRRSRTPSSARRVRGLGMRAVMLVPMLAGGARDRRDQLRQRRVRAPLQRRATSSWPRSSAAAPAPRSRTPASTASARTSPRRCSAGCCPDELPHDPRPAARLAVPPGGRGEPRRRRLLRRVPDRRPAGCCSSATSPAAAPRPPRRPARRATRCAPPGMLLGDPGAALEQLNQALAERARADAVHGRARPCHRRGPRTCSAPATRSRC